MSDVKVFIDPVDNILYSSYYIYGLGQLFGKDKICLTSEPFKELSSQSRHSWSTRIVIEKDGILKKYVVHGDDSYKINEELYNWCDVYGSVNANFGKTPERFQGKLVTLCPSFGVRCWSLYRIVMNALRFSIYEGSSFKRYLGQHKRLLARPKYSDYFQRAQGTMPNDYIFFVSTLWYNDEWNKNDEGVNLRRANFIRACKNMDNVVFEGGFVSQGKDRSSEGLFEDCLCQGVSMQEWMEKTKRSALVFNTPAFWNCHGWKLGEYLALGKCIVSTELQNDLPMPLEHGKNIHFVKNDQESMREAIRYILGHPDYRQRLERGARDYWEVYGTPIASLTLLGIGKEFKSPIGVE